MGSRDRSVLQMIVREEKPALSMKSEKRGAIEKKAVEDPAVLYSKTRARRERKANRSINNAEKGAKRRKTRWKRHNSKNGTDVNAKRRQIPLTFDSKRAAFTTLHNPVNTSRTTSQTPPQGPRQGADVPQRRRDAESAPTCREKGGALVLFVCCFSGLFVFFSGSALGG